MAASTKLTQEHPPLPSADALRYGTQLNFFLERQFRLIQQSLTELPTIAVGPPGPAGPPGADGAGVSIDYAADITWTGRHDWNPVVLTFPATVVRANAARGTNDHMAGWERNSPGASAISRYKTVISAEGYLCLLEEETGVWDGLLFPPNKSGFLIACPAPSGLRTDLYWGSYDGTWFPLTDADNGRSYINVSASYHWTGSHQFSAHDLTVDQNLLSANLRRGANTPEGVITASTGDLYAQTNASLPMLYVKYVGAGTNTGWEPLLSPVLNAYGARSNTNAGPITGIWEFQHMAEVAWDDTRNITFGTLSGTKIGTGNTQKFAFWNATPIVQPTTGVAGATRVGGGGATLTDTDTFDGYTLAQIAKALRNMGLLA